MSNGNENEVVDVDALEFDDDIEEIVISDYSGEEDDVDILENSTQNISGSGLKISSVVSCTELEFSDSCVEEFRVKPTSENDLVNQVSDSELTITSVLGDDSSSEYNFSYDSLTDGEELGESSIKHAVSERKRRIALRALYQDLWGSISSETLHPTCSTVELLTTSYDMIRKLTIAGRKLQYSAELCMQSNYRLKRKLKRMTKKKRKQSVDSRDGTKPGKVVTSRASI